MPLWRTKFWRSDVILCYLLVQAQYYKCPGIFYAPWHFLHKLSIKLRKLNANQYLLGGPCAHFVSSEALKINPGSIFAIWSKDIHSEGLWYRVKVLKVKGDKVHIEYLDYGDTGTVPASSLKSIPPRFLELPFQVCYLILAGLLPPPLYVCLPSFIHVFMHPCLHIKLCLSPPFLVSFLPLSLPSFLPSFLSSFLPFFLTFTFSPSFFSPSMVLSYPPSLNHFSPLFFPLHLTFLSNLSPFLFTYRYLLSRASFFLPPLPLFVNFNFFNDTLSFNFGIVMGLVQN